MKIVYEPNLGAYECPRLVEGSRLHQLVVDRLSMPVHVAITFPWWQCLFGRKAEEFCLFPVYVGQVRKRGIFTLFYVSDRGYCCDVRYTRNWGEQFLPLSEEFTIEEGGGLEWLPTPPFADTTPVEDPNDGNMEWTETFGSTQVLKDEVASLIRGWADSLIEVPTKVPWMYHHWASYNGPAGDYGSTWPVHLKEDVTLEEIREWANSLS